ncbi:uncharacterized protein [Spinacia oleracea]|uniref:Reverse transcriptase zinc-binding domain-containing protein n=1 Tax=Spinacia oleracea TaxID=3562 RepID=A0ABM3QRK4_SPIOL|nr:uncharacterized protein LOC110791140 [Spinacia oleracea]
MSWVLKKIFGCLSLVESVGGWDSVMKSDQFSINLMYKKLCGDFPKVPWRRVTCNNYATPKSLFILWFVILKRIPTLDRLLKWSIVTCDSYLYCNTTSESVDHLFFECGFTSQVWQRVLTLLQFAKAPAGFHDELEWVLKCSKKNGASQKLLVMFFAEAVYSIWLNRNDKLYNQHCRTLAELFKDIQFRVAARCPSDLCSKLLDLSC